MALKRAGWRPIIHLWAATTRPLWLDLRKSRTSVVSTHCFPAKTPHVGHGTVCVISAFVISLRMI